MREGKGKEKKISNKTLLLAAGGGGWVRGLWDPSKILTCERVQSLHRDIVTTSHTEDLRMRGGLYRVQGLKSYYGPLVGPVGVPPFLGVSPLF